MAREKVQKPDGLHLDAGVHSELLLRVALLLDHLLRQTSPLELLRPTSVELPSRASIHLALLSASSPANPFWDA